MTPEEALQKFDAAIDEILEAADWQTQLAELGASVEELAARDSELAAWRQTMRQRVRTWLVRGADLH
jgi:tripartite-type tricarboxylate transporter receptor subunit TctC